MAYLRAGLLEQRLDRAPPSLARRAFEIGKLHDLDRSALMTRVPLHVGVGEELAPHLAGITVERPGAADDEVARIHTECDRHVDRPVAGGHHRDERDDRAE